jgi:uncharacterized membrane protein YbaN (DUF454 family)
MNHEDAAQEVRCTGVRWALRAVGVVALALGIIGAFVPLMPTTIFLLIALWAFSRSSPRFHRWLYSHPRLGPPLRAWHEHRVISTRAKAAAVGLMGGGLVLAATVFATDGWVVGLAALVLLPVAGFILMQRGAVPAPSRVASDRP